MKPVDIKKSKATKNISWNNMTRSYEEFKKEESREKSRFVFKCIGG